VNINIIDYNHKKYVGLKSTRKEERYKEEEKERLK